MCWKPGYIILIIFSTLVAYYSGIYIGKAKTESAKKKLLIVSLVSNLGVLFFFKYFNFFNSSFKSMFEYFNISYSIPELDFLLPVGISFYTFQTLSYSIDVFRGDKKPVAHLGILALYVSFFPQLVAGPIERSTRLLPQFGKVQYFDLDRVMKGLQLILWGFFKKIVIADRLSVLVDQVYDNPAQFTGIPLIMATYFFAFQIYCDFSGYSDIAIGSAEILGFNLMENFKSPYFSKSISEFWRNWHISLSTWFRDYLYIPLGGNRVNKIRLYCNLFVVFLISGLWHGANWTFVIWGGLHGTYIIFSNLIRPVRGKISSILQMSRFPVLHRYLKILITFHLIVFAWIFFRSNSIGDAVFIVNHLFTDIGWFFTNIFEFGKGKNLLGGLVVNWPEMIFSMTLILFLIFVDLVNTKHDLNRILFAKPLVIRWLVYYCLIFAVMIFGVFEDNSFIYFQF